MASPCFGSLKDGENLGNLENFFGENFLKSWHSFSLEIIHKAKGRNMGITTKDAFVEYFEGEGNGNKYLTRFFENSKLHMYENYTDFKYHKEINICRNY